MKEVIENDEKQKKGSRAREDYLEQISNLIEEKGYARVVDIAQNLGISQASVTGMIQRMDSDGLVSYEKYQLYQNILYQLSHQLCRLIQLM